MEGYSDEIARAGGDLAKMCGAVLFVTRSLVSSKFVPAAHEAAMAATVVVDAAIRCGQEVSNEFREALAALVADIRDQMRVAGAKWKPRG
jgi:hypothetical protein